MVRNDHVLFVCQFGRVLEAELEHVAARFVMGIVDVGSKPPAPIFDGKASEGGVVLVPFGDQLLDNAGESG